MTIIDVRSLSKVYTDGEVETYALRDISFSVKKGEFVAIMGPSGCGKSTLLHILGFLDVPTSGEYYFEGKSVSNYSKDELAKTRNQKIGFIFQFFNLLPRLSVIDNVKLPLLYSDVPEAKWHNIALQAIDAVGLSYRIHHEPSQLSGGEKQRVAIARALINNPQVILADEPTGNLDSKSGEIVMDIIKSLSEKEGRTVILVTHETYTAQYAQRIINMRDGKIENEQVIGDKNRNLKFRK